MAGYVEIQNTGKTYEFHIDEENLIERIRGVTNNSRVVIFQLDGDELDAALWGFENYIKPSR